MHARTPELAREVRAARTFAEQVERMQGVYRGSTAVIASCGPSLGALPAADLREALRGVPCFAVKQAVDVVGDQTDMHCWNAFNVRRFGRPSRQTVRCIVQEPTGRVPQWNRFDVAFPQVDGKGDLGRSVAATRNFDQYLLADGRPRPFGPGIMFELVLYLVVHTGVSEVLTIGWDIASPTGGNTHFYDTAAESAFYERARRPHGAPAPRTVGGMLPPPLRRAARGAKTLLAHTRGHTYNRTTPLAGETDAVSAATADMVAWLAAHGVSIAALSESEFVGRHVPLLTPQSFVERLGERRG